MPRLAAGRARPIPAWAVAQGERCTGLRVRVDKGPQLGRALTGSSFGDPHLTTAITRYVLAPPRCLGALSAIMNQCREAGSRLVVSLRMWRHGLPMLRGGARLRRPAHISRRAVADCCGVGLMACYPCFAE